MKKTTLLLTLLMIASLSLSGCTSSTINNSTDENTATIVQSGESIDVLNAIWDEKLQEEYTEENMDSSYDLTTATIITLNNENTSIDGSGASFTNNVLTIQDAGEYVLSGELNGQILISATSDDKVQLILENASINNTTGSAIYGEQSDSIMITLADNSINSVTDGSNYSDQSEDAPNAAIASNDDLIFNGEGSLSVEGNFNHAIKTSDTLIIISGTIDVTSVNDGIRGKDAVAILDGNITVDAQGDGITATNADDESKGWISIDGGTLTISATDKGLQAESSLNVNSGEINVVAEDDAYHSNNNVIIFGGSSYLNTGDDGIHADNDLQIQDGTIDIVSEYEGIEGSNVYINGGIITIESVDDGINAASGSAAEATPADRFNEVEGDNEIVITSGDIYLSLIGDEADGLDSNGNIYLNGGNIVIDGAVSERDAAIDINKGVFEYNGGTLTSVGSTAMLVIPTTSEQPVITIIFDQYQSAKETIEIVNDDQETVLSFTPKKVYPVAMFSSPDLIVGESYSVLIDGEKLFSINVDQTTMTVDQNGDATEASTNMGGPGGQPRPGERPTRP